MESNTIGGRIKELRKRANITQEKVANALNVTRQTVDLWESGARDLKTQYTIRLADYFGVTCDYILRGVKAENVDIHETTGLSDKAIDTLKEISAPYTEPENMQSFIDHMVELDALADASGRTPDDVPINITGEDITNYGNYVLNKFNKETLRMVDALLSNGDGISILYQMSRYFNVNPAIKLTHKGSTPGFDIIIDGDMLSGMYAQAMIKAMQKYREMLRSDGESTKSSNPDE